MVVFIKIKKILGDHKMRNGFWYSYYKEKISDIDLTVEHKEMLLKRSRISLLCFSEIFNFP